MLPLMKSSVSPVCAVGRLVLAADPYKWMASTATEEWLQILVDAVGAGGWALVPRRPEAAAAFREEPADGQARRHCPADAASQWPARGRGVGGVERPQSPLRVPRAFCDPAPGPALDVGRSLGPQRSAFAVWSARAAADLSRADAEEPSIPRSSPSASVGIAPTADVLHDGALPWKRDISRLSAGPVTSSIDNGALHVVRYDNRQCGEPHAVCSAGAAPLGFHCGCPRSERAMHNSTCGGPAKKTWLA